MSLKLSRSKIPWLTLGSSMISAPLTSVCMRIIKFHFVVTSHPALQLHLVHQPRHLVHQCRQAPQLHLVHQHHPALPFHRRQAAKKETVSNVQMKRPCAQETRVVQMEALALQPMKILQGVPKRSRRIASHTALLMSQCCKFNTLCTSNVQCRLKGGTGV